MITINTINDKKDKILKLLEADEFINIIEKDIKDKKGLIGVSNKYVNCKAIILIYNNDELET